MAVSQTLTLTEVGVNTTNNTSQVKILWQSTQTGSSYNNNSREATYYVSINGGEEKAYYVRYTLPKNSTTTILETTLTVDHNADGSGSIKVRTWMQTNIFAGVEELTKSLTLTTISRESVITAAYTTTLGNKCKLVWTPLSADFYYKVKFTLGTFSHITEEFCPGITTPYTYSEYTIPLDVATNFPNVKSGIMTATIYTYTYNEDFWGKGEYVQVGTESSTHFTVELPDNESTKPSLEMTLSLVNSLPEPFSSLCLQGKSHIAATFAGEGKYGAEIAVYELSADGIYITDTTDPYQIGAFQTSGKTIVRGKATDTRGISRTVEEEINVIPYGKPYLSPLGTMNTIVCARCDEKGNLTDSGTYLRFKAKRVYSKLITDETQNNFCEIRYRYVTENDDFTDDGWITLLGDDASDDIDVVLLEGKLENDTAYIVQIGVFDTVGESDVVQYTIPTDFITIDIPEFSKGKRIGILRFASDTSEPGVDFGAPIHGGSVDSLKLGTKITATENARVNLDEMRTPGCFYSSDKETTQYISNTPSGVDFGFGLEVREMQSEADIRQTLYYGITTWYRHRSWNGSENKYEWSAWVSTIRGKSDEVIADDFVVDSGDSGLWSYRLWQSGEAELWGRITLAEFGDARSIKCVAGLPFPFTAKPTVNMTLSEATAYEYRQGQIVLSEVYSVGASTITLYMIRNEGGLADGNTADVSVNIKGKWK